MLAFDLQNGDGRPHRVAVIGSCRIRNPLLKLRSDAVKYVATKPPLTHSFKEARQIIRFVGGELTIPNDIAPYIFDIEQATDPKSYPPDLLSSIDTFLVEMCDLKQIVYGDFVFQNNYFARNFVQKHGAELLNWYRSFSRGHAPDENLVASALQSLAASGKTSPPIMEDILRRARLVLPNDATIEEDARRLQFDRSKRWIFVSHFSDPEDDSTVMDDRRRLSGGIEAAARSIGAEFFDPSRMIEHYGRAVVMRGHGADIYEYAHAFVPVVSDILLNILRNGSGADLKFPPLPPDAVVTNPAPAARHRPAATPRKPAASNPRPIAVPRVVPTPVAALPADKAKRDDNVQRANKMLIDVLTDRREQLGVEQSGLYEHFDRQLQAGQMVRTGDVKLARLLVDHVPRYDRYVVLRAGIGSLPVLLALEGMTVTACETNVNRVEAIEAVVKRLRSSRPRAGELISVAQSWRGVKRLNEGESLIAITAGLLAPSEIEQEVITELTTFNALIVEPKKFLRDRSSPSDLTEIYAILRKAGFTEMQKLPSANLVLFQRTAAGSDVKKAKKKSSKEKVH